MKITEKPIHFCLSILGGLFILFLSSCGTSKNSVYFSDIDSAKIRQLSAPEFREPLIQTDDNLSITVQTIDPGAAVAVNQSPESSSGNAGIINGFRVDKNGNVEIPMLGVVKLAGLTTTEAKEVVRLQATKFYKNPTIQVRFANYKITVLGEVAKPSSYIMPNEKVTILDAISLAGDLTIFGKRENVMLIRDNGTKKDIIRLDLTSSSLITSPYFYLKQNDVLYVEPSKAKISANNAPRNQMITIGLAVATLLITAISRF